MYLFIATYFNQTFFKNGQTYLHLIFTNPVSSEVGLGVETGYASSRDYLIYQI